MELIQINAIEKQALLTALKEKVVSEYRLSDLVVNDALIWKLQGTPIETVGKIKPFKRKSGVLYLREVEISKNKLNK